MIAGARLRSSITRCPAYRAPAAVKLAIAQRNAAPIVSRWGQVRFGFGRLVSVESAAIAE